MIKQVTPRVSTRWSQQTAGGQWRRVWFLGSRPQRRVRTADGSPAWTIWEDGVAVFSGTKQQCEDWLDWHDRKSSQRAVRRMQRSA